MNPGHHYFFDASVARVAMIGLFFAIGFTLEWIASISKITLQHRVFNCACGIFFQLTDIVTSFYVGVLVYSLVKHPLISIAASDRHHFLFALALAFAWMALRDFFYYWLHRWQHSSKWLWAEHALHHSDEDMNLTTAVRHHWLENPLNAVFVTAPLMILFRAPLISIPFAYLCTYSVSYLIHCNIRLNSGVLAKFIATPQTHRIHHSRHPEHVDKNFAQFFPLWDVIFGTYYAPHANEFPETGLASGETVTTIRQALIMPFRSWAAMLKSSQQIPIKQASAAGEKAAL
jgi:sterol desaturase/sphingolipid hydroxylase (fatty acid hydroxylase superfamily)